MFFVGLPAVWVFMVFPFSWSVVVVPVVFISWSQGFSLVHGWSLVS